MTNSQQTPQTRAKRSALSQQVTTKHKFMFTMIGNNMNTFTVNGYGKPIEQYSIKINWNDTWAVVTNTVLEPIKLYSATKSYSTVLWETGKGRCIFKINQSCWDVYPVDSVLGRDWCFLRYRQCDSSNSKRKYLPLWRQDIDNLLCSFPLLESESKEKVKYQEWYNQVPHLPKATCGKVTKTQAKIT